MSAIAPHCVWFFLDGNGLSGFEEIEKRNLVVGDGGLEVGERREEESKIRERNG